MSTIDDIVEQVGKNRGLWVGAFPTDSSITAEMSDQLVVVNHPSVIETIVPRDDHHVTLVHFGKRNGRRQVEAIDAACQIVTSGMPAVGIKVLLEGGLRMQRHVVIAIASERLHWLKSALDSALRDRGVDRNTTFETLLHLTLGTVSPENHVIMPNMARGAISVSAVTLCCGDHRVDYPFSQASPF